VGKKKEGVRERAVFTYPSYCGERRRRKGKNYDLPKEGKEEEKGTKKRTTGVFTFHPLRWERRSDAGPPILRKKTVKKKKRGISANNHSAAGEGRKIESRRE